MKRWTNGLPGATTRLGAMMALRGLSASQPRMRADTHDGPEQIAPLQRPDTLMQLSRSLILEIHLVPHGRAIHYGTKRRFAAMPKFDRYWRHSGHAASAGRVSGTRALVARSGNYRRELLRSLANRAPAVATLVSAICLAVCL